MSDPARRFEVVEDEPQAAPVAPRRPQGPDKATQALLLALSALSQRAVIALSSLYSAALVASAWYLFLVTLPDPSVYQLVGLSLYGALIISVHLLNRRG